MSESKLSEREEVPPHTVSDKSIQPTANEIRKEGEELRRGWNTWSSVNT
jgi:hypothetical protein